MLTILITASAFAQSPELTDKPEVVVPKETIIDFEGVDLKGDIVKPELQIIEEWAPSREGSLIRLRTSFQSELNESIDYVK